MNMAPAATVRVNLIRGKAGTKVRLELVTADGGKTNTMEITRTKFQIAKR